MTDSRATCCILGHSEFDEKGCKWKKKIISFLRVQMSASIHDCCCLCFLPIIKVYVDKSIPLLKGTDTVNPGGMPGLGRHIYTHRQKKYLLARAVLLLKTKCCPAQSKGKGMSTRVYKVRRKRSRPGFWCDWDKKKCTRLVRFHPEGPTGCVLYPSPEWEMLYFEFLSFMIKKNNYKLFHSTVLSMELVSSFSKTPIQLVHPKHTFGTTIKVEEKLCTFYFCDIMFVFLVKSVKFFSCVLSFLVPDNEVLL